MAISTVLKHLISYFHCDDPAGNDNRNILLTIFTLIAGATSQAGVNPPGGVWQDNQDGHVAGRAIYASQKKAYYVFLIFNTVAFSNSILVIFSLASEFSRYVEIRFATFYMVMTYGSAIFAISPAESINLRYVVIAFVGPFAVRFLFNLFRRKDGNQNQQG